MEDYSLYFNNNNSDILFDLYSGLNQVQLKNGVGIDLCYFHTYTSTSYNKNVSIQFAKNNGMLMQFDKNIVLKKQFRFCSLEWISKFENECEILFARTESNFGRDYEKAARMSVLNNLSNKNSLQIVNVSRIDTQTNGIKLLKQEEMEYWQTICIMGNKGKDVGLKWWLDNNEELESYGSKSDFENGLNLFYNDITFSKYIIKVKENNYKLNQMDFIKMQKQSKLIKYLIKEKGAFGEYYYRYIMKGEDVSSGT